MRRLVEQTPRVDGAGTKLTRSFYARPTLTVAQELLGKRIVYHSPSGTVSARIVEVEAYIGQNDPACHAARGRTERTEVMFGPPGRAYIYLIYGMYYCLNFVTEPADKPAAILLRAAEPKEGVDIMALNSPGKKAPKLLSGPGCFCRSFGLTKDQNAIDLTGDVLYLEDSFDKTSNVCRSGRVGIKEGVDNMWRFYDGDSKAVSKPR